MKEVPKKKFEKNAYSQGNQRQHKEFSLHPAYVEDDESSSDELASRKKSQKVHKVSKLLTLRKRVYLRKEVPPKKKHSKKKYVSLEAESLLDRQ